MKNWLEKRKEILGKALIAVVVLGVAATSLLSSPSGAVAETFVQPVGSRAECTGGVYKANSDTDPNGPGTCTITLDDSVEVVGSVGASAVKEPDLKNTCIKIAGVGFARVPYAFNFTSCMVELSFVVLTIFSAAVALAGFVLDMAINITILHFKEWLSNIGAIKTAWTVLRDVLTMTFIFILLYAGIKMILGLGTPTKILTGVVIAGLLINFSFFFTSVIIDVSNVLTVEIHQSIKTIGDKFKGRGGVVAFGGISGALMQGLAPQETFQNPPPGISPDDHDLAILINIIFGVVLFLIVSVVLFAIALLLFIRFIMLIILLITSPIMVISDDLLPQLSQWRKKWWDELISQSIFAPLLLVFLAITVVIISDGNFKAFTAPDLTGETTTWTALIMNIASQLIQSGIVIGLLIAGLIISKSFSGQMGGKVTGWAEKTARGIATAPGRITRYGASVAGRNTIGWAGSAVATSNYANRLKASNNLAAQWTGSKLAGGGARLANVEFGAGKNASYAGRAKQLKSERDEATKQIEKNVAEAKKKDADRREKDFIASAAGREISRIDAHVAQLETERQELGENLNSGLLLTGQARADAEQRQTTIDTEIQSAQDRKAVLQTQEGAEAYSKTIRTEKEAREVLAAIAETITPEDAGVVSRAAKEKDKDKRDKMIRELNDNQRKYYDAMQELVEIEKRKGAYEKDYVAKFAATNASVNSEAIQGVTDKMRKELAQNKKDEFYEKIKQVIEEDQPTQGGGAPKTEGNADSGGTSGGNQTGAQN